MRGGKQTSKEEDDVIRLHSHLLDLCILIQSKYTITDNLHLIITNTCTGKTETKTLPKARLKQACYISTRFLHELPD